jgi:hypothetical protein
MSERESLKSNSEGRVKKSKVKKSKVKKSTSKGAGTLPASG